MYKRLTFLIISLLFTASLFGQTSMEGKVTDQVTGEPILFGTIAIFKNDVLVTGTETDLDGNYVFSNIDPGTYDVEVSYVGYQTVRVAGVLVKAGQININNVNISEGVTMTEVVVVGYKEPLIDFDNTTQGGTVTAEEIRSLPTKNISAIAATTAGISTSADGDISVRGSREDGTYFYVDGVRVSGDNVNNFVAQSEIDQLQVITGGIEAKYGDVTGGIISVTTKGPSDSFSGGIELETSEFLDDFGYNLGSGYLSGPILKNKEDKTILGYRFFGQYRRVEDDSPSAIGVYRLSEDRIAELENNPAISLGGTLVPTAESLTLEDVGEQLPASPNETDIDYNVVGKLDARITDNVDVTLSGSYFNSNNRFTPSTSTSRADNQNGLWSLLNWTNNPFADTEGYRGNFRFRHKIGKQGFSGDDEDPGVVRNASYTIQFGYEKTFESTEDVRHGQNLFNYGYYGTTNINDVPVASVVSDTSLWDGQLIQDQQLGLFWAHQGNNAEVGEYNPDTDVNLALSQLNETNGTPVPTLNSLWGANNNGLFYNVGRVYNRVYKFEEDRYTLNASSSFDILPGGSEKGKHNLQFGVMYEQRIQREWSITPEALWELARTNANIHINGVDTDIVVDSFTFQIPGGEQTFLEYQNFTQEEEFQDNLFFRAIRDELGLELHDAVFADELTPDQITLDMFSASELNDFTSLNLNYFGFDYLGNELESGTTFNDFFTAEDENGRRTFPVAPLQPIYWAGYIQDKFKYKDIIIRLGVRVDSYDANTKVLKDPYSLYDIETAGEFYARTGQTQPEAVDDSYKVYLTGDESDVVKGFREGDNWFLPNGTGISGGNLLFGGELVFPSFVNSVEEREINARGFDPDISFEDYTPQLNVMPRAAFSFPITEDAGFFAHYDVLVQRPPSNVGGTALDYFYAEIPGRFGTATVAAPNPDLRPEKTVDYEVGFQSKISGSSAIKISAYYKEMRDMIQQRFYLFLPAPITQYQTFGNLDFGTVKGFSLSYDLRRTGNIQLNAAYTLQFADGSGSDANSASGLNENGIIRTLFPLNFDERHSITSTVDWRYGSGKQYNGPRIGSTDIFANAGINLLLRTVSGRPYSQYSTITQPLGRSGLQTINEARLPWFFNADVRIDKQFNVALNKETGKSLGLNVYFRVQNLFNTRNIIDVYSVTGNPDDDGYLQSAAGNDRLESIEGIGKSVDSFLAAYTWRVANPEAYSLPRRMFLGLMIDF